MITPEQARHRWQGVVVPLVTIFAQDSALDLQATADHVRWIIDRGARQGNTVFLAATAGGDCTQMNLEERKQVIRAIARAVDGRVPIIAGAQSCDIRECIALCQLCDELGVDGVQIAGQYYYDGRPGDVIAWFEELARHTEVGFAVYNNWYTGYNMPLDLVDRLLDIPNSVGIKWSSPDIHTFYAGIRRFLPRAAVLDNNLKLPVEPHMLGCRGFISMVPNFFPEHSWRVWDLLEQGLYLEAQRSFDEFTVPYRDLVGQILQVTNGDGIHIRVAMEAAGLPAGPSRLPSRDDAVSPEIREGFRKLLVQTGAVA